MVVEVGGGGQHRASRWTGVKRRRGGIIWGCSSNPRRPALCGYGGKVWCPVQPIRAGWTCTRTVDANGALSKRAYPTKTLRGGVVASFFPDSDSRQRCLARSPPSPWQARMPGQRTGHGPGATTTDEADSCCSPSAPRSRPQVCCPPRGRDGQSPRTPILHHGSVAGTPSPRSLKESALTDHPLRTRPRCLTSANSWSQPPFLQD